MGLDSEQTIFWTAFEKTLKTSELGTTSREVLDVIANPELRVQAIAAVLLRNPAYEHFLIRLPLLQERIVSWLNDEGKSLDRDRLILERTLGLLGKTASRNALLSMRIQRGFSPKMPKLPKDSFDIKPQESLRYAIAADDHCQNFGIPFPETAFEAGLHFDWLIASVATTEIASEIKGYVKNLWNEALLTARIAYELCTALRRFRHEQYVFGAGLLVHLGGVMLAILHPREQGDFSWAQFLSDHSAMKGETREVIWPVLERDRFRVSSAELSCLFASFFGRFHSVEKALCYFREPETLRGIDRDLYVLAVLLSVASCQASDMKKTQPITERQKRRLNDLGISESVALERIARARKAMHG